MSLESFQKRDQTELHSDGAASLSPFEQKLARLKFWGTEAGRWLLINPEVVCATTHLVEKRERIEWLLYTEPCTDVRSLTAEGQ